MLRYSGRFRGGGHPKLEEVTPHKKSKTILNIRNKVERNKSKISGKVRHQIISTLCHLTSISGATVFN